MDESAEFFERLRELFLLSGEKVCSVAEKINVTSAAIYGYLSGDHIPNLESAVRLAQYFECSLDYLFGFTDRKEPQDRFPKEQICKRLTRAIAESGKTKYSLAKEYEFDESQLYRWCHGKSRPSLLSLAKLAEALDCPLNFLAGY